MEHIHREEDETFYIFNKKEDGKYQATITESSTIIINWQQSLIVNWP